MTPVKELLAEAAGAVRQVLVKSQDWRLTGTRGGQYFSDVAADERAVEVLLSGGVGVLSEESGLRGADKDYLVVLDPVDGSSNAAAGVPWYSVSLCAVDAQGAAVAHVENLVSGTTFTATRGAGALCDGNPVKPSGETELSSALVGLSGYPAQHWGWRQFRALGSAALDLCLVASGALDGFADCTKGELAPWDYLGGMLVCQEAGAKIQDARGQELLTLDYEARRRPVAAATQELLLKMSRFLDYPESVD